MRPSRGFLLVVLATAVVIGVLRGLITGFVAGTPAMWTLLLVAMNLPAMLIWVPTAAAIWWALTRPGASERAAALAALCLISLLIQPWAAGLLRYAGAPMRPYVSRAIGGSDTNLLFFIATAGAAWAAMRRRRQIASEVAAARLETALSDAQLHVLTLQLHPHFLFNALNLISQLAYESTNAAQKTIANLRALLVASLEHAAHREVPLDEELRFLRAYVDIQQLRFADRLQVAIDCAPDAERAMVPHLLLQPLVENAIVHGISPRAAAGRLTVAIRRADSRLLCSIADDGIGVPSPRHEGMGLTNTRLRLEQLFGANYRLSIVARRGGGTVVTVDIPYRESAAAPAAEPTEIPSLTTADAESGAPSVALPRIPLAIPVVAGWAAIAALWTAIESASALSIRSTYDAAAGFTSLSANAGLWAILTPFVVWFARRMDLTNAPGARRIAAHVGLAVAIAIGHVTLWLGVLRAIHSPEFEPEFRSMFGWMMWDLVAYAAIVAFSMVAAFAGRYRDARIAMARTEARLAGARLATLRLRLQPAILLSALDALARVTAIDPVRAESAITRMGDLLRMLLARADRDVVDATEEIDLLRAYLDVRRSPGAQTSVTEVALDEQSAAEPLPAMLLPALAAAFGGGIDRLAIEHRDGGVSIECTAAASGDPSALAEVRDRLAGMYAGGASLAQRAVDGATHVSISLPALAHDSSQLPSMFDDYGLARA